MRLNPYITLLPLYIFLASCQPSQQGSGNEQKENHMSWVDSALNRSVEAYNQLLSSNPGMDRYPRTFENGEFITVSSPDWTSGFFPATLWYLYEYSGDEALGKAARKFSKGLFNEKNNTSTHDLGFMLFCSLGNGYRVEEDPQYKEVLLEGLNSLAGRFNPKVGAIKSWDWGQDQWTFPVIIDNMMNLEYLFWATKVTGDSSYYQMAVSHAEKTLAHHYRDDVSTWHVLDYDMETGEPVNKLTHQGYSDASEWARGQAWGLYGYVMCYRETKDKRFLEQGKAIARYWMEHPAIPEDKVPYWDFDDPAIPNAPRDASAAAIVASALLELSHLTGDENYRDYALDILKSLASTAYMTTPGENGNFILVHSTGNKPKNSEVDVPLIYADYYFVEALLRSKKWSVTY